MNAEHREEPPWGAKSKLARPREFRQQRRAAFQALGRPSLGGSIVFDLCRGIGRERQPWVLGPGVDVDVGREARGFVQRSDADETDGLAGGAIVAPNGDLAGWAS